MRSDPLQRGHFFARQEQREHRAVVDRMHARPHAQPALVALDDACGDPQTEAGAIEVFGGVEGLEDAREHFLAHAVAGVGHGNADA